VGDRFSLPFIAAALRSVFFRRSSSIFCFQPLPRSIRRDGFLGPARPCSLYFFSSAVVGFSLPFRPYNLFLHAAIFFLGICFYLAIPPSLNFTFTAFLFASRFNAPRGLLLSRTLSGHFDLLHSSYQEATFHLLLNSLLPCVYIEWCFRWGPEMISPESPPLYAARTGLPTDLTPTR